VCSIERQELELLLCEPVGWLLQPATSEAVFQTEAHASERGRVIAVSTGVPLHCNLQVRVFGPRCDPAKTLGHEVGFTSPQFAAFSAVR
jgi:hypothetical protein